MQPDRRTFGGPIDGPPKLFDAHAPMPKNHGYGNTWRNAAEAKWRANQQDKQQRAVAKQLGLQLPEANPKKRAHDAEPGPPPLAPGESEEQRRIRAWSEYYAAMALEEGRTPEERTQAEAWATYYAEQVRQLSGAAAAAAAAALTAGGGGSEHQGPCSEAGESSSAAPTAGLSSSERKRAKAAASASPLKLLTAVLDGGAHAARQQILHGMSPDTADDEGTPLVVLASKLNHPAVLKELLAASAEVDAADRGGFTALHYACIENRRKLVELLLEHGADPLIKTKAGDAPIMLVHSSQKILRQKIGDAARARFAH